MLLHFVHRLPKKFDTQNCQLISTIPSHFKQAVNYCRSPWQPSDEDSTNCFPPILDGQFAEWSSCRPEWSLVLRCSHLARWKVKSCPKRKPEDFRRGPSMIVQTGSQAPIGQIMETSYDFLAILQLQCVVVSRWQGKKFQNSSSKASLKRGRWLAEFLLANPPKRGSTSVSKEECSLLSVQSASLEPCYDKNEVVCGEGHYHIF